MEYCGACDRLFRNIVAHWTHSSRHVYCVRCDRHFVSADARQQHWDNSCVHNICTVCGFDAEDADDLEGHFRATGCYTHHCHGCNTWFTDSQRFSAHVNSVCACRICDKHCMNPNNLAQHMIAHQDATHECWGCYRSFVRISHMILHLESGTCPTGCKLCDIDYDLMGRCRNLRRFVDADYVEDFRSGVDIGLEYGPVFPFECKGCGATFRLLSSLCQHMENCTTCTQRISDVSFRPLQRLFEHHFL